MFRRFSGFEMLTRNLKLEKIARDEKKRREIQMMATAIFAGFDEERQELIGAVEKAVRYALDILDEIDLIEDNEL